MDQPDADHKVAAASSSGAHTWDRIADEQPGDHNDDVGHQQLQRLAFVAVVHAFADDADDKPDEGQWQRPGKEPVSGEMIEWMTGRSSERLEF